MQKPYKKLLPLKKELETLKSLSLYRIAEDIYHAILVMNLSEKDLDSLISQKNILQKLASEIQDSRAYDTLLNNAIIQFLER